jgi:hypothetical protein
MNRRTAIAAGLAVVLALAGAVGYSLRTRPAVPTSAASSGRSPNPAAEVDEIVRASRKSPPVIVLGLDGADWPLLQQFIADGAMPNLAKLAAEGAVSAPDTLHPPLSPLLWTSMLTGVSPLNHGILDFIRLDPSDGRKEPITTDERRAPAIWNMASQGGRSVAVFGLWATYPAESVRGLMVSDRLFTFLFDEERPPAGVVFPAAEESWARSVVKSAEQSIDLPMLKTYLPWLTDADYRKALAATDVYGFPPAALRRTLIETRVYDQLARGWLSRHTSDLTVVYFQGTDVIGHTFAPFAPPKLPAIAEDDYRRYSSVPRTYFAEIDRLLGTYRTLAEQTGARLVVVSDHGFVWGEGRPTTISSYAHATAAKWHRKQGVGILWGPGIAARDARSETASVIQVTPTLLAMLGLPPLRDAVGQPLPGTPVFDAQPVDYARHFTPPRPPPASAQPRAIDEDALARLRALGYIGASDSAAGRRVAPTRSAGSYNNEGLLLQNEGRLPEARTAFENALIVDPNMTSAMWNLSDLLFQGAADLDRSDLLLVRAFAMGLPDGKRLLIGRAIGYQRSQQTARSVKLLDSAIRAKPEEPDAWLFRGRYMVDTGDCARAVSDIEKAVRLAPANPAAHASLGLARLCAGDREGALRDLRRSLQIDPSQPTVRDYIRKLEREPR